MQTPDNVYSGTMQCQVGRSMRPPAEHAGALGSQVLSVMHERHSASTFRSSVEPRTPQWHSTQQREDGCLLLYWVDPFSSAQCHVHVRKQHHHSNLRASDQRARDGGESLRAHPTLLRPVRSANHSCYPRPMTNPPAHQP